MAQSNELVIGEYEQFTGDSEAAVVTGAKAERVCSILSTRPPFRDPKEAIILAQDDDLDTEARDLAENAAGCSDLVEAISQSDPMVDAVVISRSGVLALRAAALQSVSEEAFGLIAALNGNDAIAIHEP